MVVAEVQDPVNPWFTFALGAASGILFPVAAEWLRRTLLDSRRLSVRHFWGRNPTSAAAFSAPALWICGVNERATPVVVEAVELEVTRSGTTSRRTYETRPADYFVSCVDSCPKRLEQSDSFTLAIDGTHLGMFTENGPFSVRCRFSDSGGKTWRSKWITIPPSSTT